MGACSNDDSTCGINLIMNFKLRLVFYICVMIYKFALDYSYIKYVSEIFQYAGFLLDLNLFNYILSSLIVTVFIFLVPYEFEKISDWFLNFFFLLVIMPIACMFGLNKNLSIDVFLLNILVYIIIFFMLKIKQVKVVNFSKVNNGELFFLIFSIFLIFYLISWYFLTGAISNFNLDFSRVYEFREVNSELTNIGIASYINNWVYQIFSLALLGYGFLRKNKIIILFSIVSQVIFFGVSAHKSVLFSIFMIVGLYYYFKITKSLIVIPVFLSLIIMISMIIYWNDSFSIYPSMFVRRFIFVPAQLSYAYFDFFQINPYDFWSRSFLSSIKSTNYPEGVSKTIGYFLGTEASANNGFVSSGYAQAGLFGVVLYAFLTGYLLKNIDYLANSNNYPLWFSLIVIVNPLKNLILSSDLFTVLLTHGLLISILILFLLNNVKRNKVP